MWPAAFALIVTASGGGVNAAVTAWILVGPLLLALYERWTGRASWRELWGFGWRTALTTGLVSAWWVVPLLVQSRFGVDFLRFTEQPGTIWSTTSLSESLRLMGYWISYLGVGYGGELRPYFGDGGVLLFALPVIVAGLLVPALALTGFAWSRKDRYGPFALLLVLVGLLVMAAGFPEGTPLRRASNFTYNHFALVQFLRTTYKAGPLVVIGLAVLAGLGAAHVPRRAWLVPLLVLPLVASWPLIRGRAVDDQLLWERIPAAWVDAAEHVDARARPRGRPARSAVRLLRLGRDDRPDPAGPGRHARRHAQRRRLRRPARDRPAVDRRRARPAAAGGPGQLDPLLDLLGARTVVAGADDDRTRSGAAPAAEAADVARSAGAPFGRLGAGRAAAAGGGDARGGAGAAAGARLGPAGRARARARRAGRSGGRRRRLRRRAGRARGVRSRRRRGLRGRSHGFTDPPRRRDRHHRFQPAPDPRAVAAGAERGTGAGGRRAAVGGRRAAEPVPVAGRPDRRRL